MLFRSRYDVTQGRIDLVFFIFKNYLFIYFWLRWVFFAVHGLLIAVVSLVAEHGL